MPERKRNGVQSCVKGTVVTDEVARDELLEIEPERRTLVLLAQDALLDLAHGAREAAQVSEEGADALAALTRASERSAGLATGTLKTAQHFEHGAAIGAGLAPIDTRQFLDDVAGIGSKSTTGT